MFNILSDLDTETLVLKFVVGFLGIILRGGRGPCTLADSSLGSSVREYLQVRGEQQKGLPTLNMSVLGYPVLGTLQPGVHIHPIRCLVKRGDRRAFRS